MVNRTLCSSALSHENERPCSTVVLHKRNGTLDDISNVPLGSKVSVHRDTQGAPVGCDGTSNLTFPPPNLVWSCTLQEDTSHPVDDIALLFVKYEDHSAGLW